jgi:hypothetical protein
MSKELFRILSGKIIADIGQRKYVLNPISHEKKYLIEKKCEELLEEYLQNSEIMSQKDIKFKALLFRLGLPPNYNEVMKKLSKDMEDKKVQIYESANNKGDTSHLKAEYKAINDKYNVLFYKLHSMDTITSEGLVDLYRARKEIGARITRRVSTRTIDAIIEWLTRNYIKEETYRTLARSSTLSNMINAGNIFNNYPLTDEQISLMYWHKFYVNVSSHQEKPFDWIVNDDLALDGWYISQSRKVASQESVNYVDSKIISNQVRNSEEVYVVRQPGTNMHEEVLNANDATGKALIQARFSLINKGKLDVSTEQQLAKGFGLK